MCLGATGQVVQTKGLYFGASLKNNGWGLTMHQQMAKQNNAKHIYEIDIQTHRHAKEVNVVNPNARNPRTYVFGKMYKVGTLKLQTGIQKNISDFRSNQHMHLSLALSGGLILATLKPVYLDIYHASSTNDGQVVPEKYDPYKHTNQLDIIGRSKGRYGWDELYFKWGLQVKPSVNLHWGGVTTSAKMMKFGCIVEYFPSGLPIMAFTHNPKTYFSIFTSFLIGNETEL